MSMCVLMRSIVPNAASNYVCVDSKQLAAGNVGDRSGVLHSIALALCLIPLEIRRCHIIMLCVGGDKPFSIGPFAKIN